MVATISDQIESLGVGQVNAPEVISLDMALNVDVLQQGLGAEEDFFHGGVMFHAGQPPFMGDSSTQEVV